MRPVPFVLITALVLGSQCAVGADIELSPADRAGAFKAGGYQLKGKKWFACAEGTISEVRDINGDGLPDVVISEGGTECHGMTGAGYSLVSKQANGTWKLLSGGTGIPSFLKTQGVGGWPDLEVGGPGFCFPVLRWNGKHYALARYEYEGRRCKR